MKVVLSQFMGIDNTPGLPLASGCLIASAKMNPTLAHEVRFAIKVRRQAVDRAVAEYADADVLGFSLYPWNMEYSLSVVRAAKQANPDRLIVVGGPAVPRRPETAQQFAHDHPDLDVLVFAEGEVAFRQLLLAHLRKVSFDQISGIAFRRAGEHDLQFTLPARQLDLSQTASPYLDGTFDELIETDRACFSMALCETNRGCPFSCTFCDWSLTKHVVEFSRERVHAELDWIAANGFNHMCICDANFGIRPRDVEIAEYLARLKRDSGSPTFCYFYLTKNDHQRNLKTIEILHEAGIGCCVGLAVQDFDDEVLKAVKRDNIQSGESEQLGEICSRRGIATHNELILGLPRQTYDSFTTTVLRAMPSYPSHDFVVYLARLLDNTEMADPEERERFGLLTRRCLWKSSDTSWDSVVDEYQELVVGSDDMPPEAWGRTYRFSYFASAAYNFRLLRVVLRYLRDELQIDVREYLGALCDHTQQAPTESVFAALGRTLSRYMTSILAGGSLVLEIEGGGAAPAEVDAALVLDILRDLDSFYAEALARTQRFLTERGLEVALLEEVFRYQRLLAPEHGKATPLEVSFTQDWLAFETTAGATPLIARANRVRFTPPRYVTMSTLSEVFATHVACLRAKISLGHAEYVSATLPRVAETLLQPFPGRARGKG